MEEIHVRGMEHLGLVNNAGIDSMEVEDVPAQQLVLEASLTRCAWSLHDLWKKCEFGLIGYKPAKDWTSQERYVQIDSITIVGMFLDAYVNI